MLPKNMFNYLPDPLAENLDKSGKALIDYIDSFCLIIKEDILSIWYVKYPEKAKEVTLNSFGEYLAVDIKDSDTAIQKRQKIANAIKGHKLRGTWKFDIKILIDSITGKNSSLVKATTVFTQDDSIIVKDNSEENSLYSTIGTDGINLLGTSIPVIQTNVPATPGIVVIDLGLTEEDVYFIREDDSIIVKDNSEENSLYSTIGTDGINELGLYIPNGEISKEILTLLDKLKINLIDNVPAYEKVYLGYIDKNSNYKTLLII